MSCSSCAPPHFGHFAGVSRATIISLQSSQSPRRDAMSPPQLPRDAPVMDVVHPVQIHLPVVFRNDRDLAGLHRGNRLLRQRLDLDEPLRRKPRLDDRSRAVALTERNRVVLRARRGIPARSGPPPPARAPQNGPAPRTGRHSRSSCCARRSLRSAAGCDASPASKSLGSCAGVTFTAPVPNSGCASSSVMIGISRFISGSSTFFPCRCV